MFVNFSLFVSKVRRRIYHETFLQMVHACKDLIFINTIMPKSRHVYLLVILNMFLHEVGIYLYVLMRV